MKGIELSYIAEEEKQQGSDRMKFDNAKHNASKECMAKHSLERAILLSPYFSVGDKVTPASTRCLHLARFTFSASPLKHSALRILVVIASLSPPFKETFIRN